MRRQFGSIRRFPSGNYQARYMHHGTMYTAPGTFSRKSAAEAWLDDERNYLDRVHRGIEAFTPPKQRAATITQITNGFTPLKPIPPEIAEAFHQFIKTQPPQEVEKLLDTIKTKHHTKH